jgi:hypothetical protein
MARHRPSRTALAACAAVALALTGCGSTVQQREAVALGSVSDAGLGPAPGSAVPATPGGVPGTPGLPSAGSPSAPGTTAPSQPGSPSTPDGTSPGPQAHRSLDGPGVTPHTIAFGFGYLKNTAAQQAALGNTVAEADVASIIRILVKDVNDHGGIAGRAIAPVYHPIDASSTQTASQVAQAECADFTQDHKVFAVLGGSNDDFLACMHRHGAVALQAGNVVGGTTAEYDRYPESVDYTALTVERVVRNLVPALVANRYFDPWNAATGTASTGTARVGILVPDRPRYRAAVPLLVRLLQAQGVTVPPQDVAYFAWPTSSAGDAQAVASIQSYVLKFRSDGVTHVIPLEQNATVFFAAAADAQHYRPRYALSSGTAAQQYVGNLIPPSQLEGAVGYGWFPALDLSSSDNPDNGPYSSAARRHCLDLLRRNGQTFGSTNAEAEGLYLCDALYGTKAIFERTLARGPLTQRTVAATLDAGVQLPSANLVTLSYGPHHRDAPSAGWYWRYESSCQCLRYVGKRFALS